MRSTPWTRGPWMANPSMEAVTGGDLDGVHGETITGHVGRVYDRELIALAPEMAEVILALSDGEWPFDAPRHVEREIDCLADRLRAIGGGDG